MPQITIIKLMTDLNFEIFKNFNFEAFRGIFGHSEENKKVLELNFTPDNTP